MDLRELDRSLVEARLKLQPPPPPATGTPIHRLSGFGNYATPTAASINRSIKAEDSDKHVQDENQGPNVQRHQHSSGGKATSSTVRAPSPGRLKQLSTDKSQFFLEMERRKDEAEQRERELARSKAVINEAEARHASQRLYEEAQRRERRLARLRLEERQREKTETPTTPCHRSHSLSSSMISAPRTPLYERADEIVKQREANLSKIRTSLRSSEQKSQSRVVVDPQQVIERLLSEAEALEKRREQDRLMLLELEKPRGAPEINEQSRRIFEQKNRERRLSFVERQDQELRRRESVILERQTEEAAKAIIKPSKVLSPNSVRETFHRLAEEDVIKLKERRESIQREYFSQFKFAPRIDETSRALAPKGSGGIESLYKNETGAERKQRLAEKLEQERMKDCTFHPAVVGNASWVDGVDLEERRQKREQERQERLRQAKWEAEMKEASECTFRPLVNPSPRTIHRRLSSPAANQPVKGMDQFLERKRLAEELKEQQREREERVFMQKLPPMNRRYTIAQPFNLSG